MSAAALSIGESDILLFSPVCMRERMVNFRVGAVLLTTRMERVVATLFEEVKDYELACVNETETVMCWGRGVEVGSKMERECFKCCRAGEWKVPRCGGKRKTF